MSCFTHYYFTKYRTRLTMLKLDREIKQRRPISYTSRKLYPKALVIQLTVLYRWLLFYNVSASDSFMNLCFIQTQYRYYFIIICQTVEHRVPCVGRTHLVSSGRSGRRNLDWESQLGAGRQQDADAGERWSYPDVCHVQNHFWSPQHRQCVAGDSIAQWNGLHEQFHTTLEPDPSG